ncbi:hypothetical protein Caci_6518 [Catenulispora acidiphila DSM 44928]|uniref:Secreted protein n=1 Tax=Catenulispora acidiphila (strain DSM 44928 / JCM 14897 / NBRC 102108 / NRRL B-24433 / ID139908) TaxID=479433 RepID=C7PY77_CATAD|nr:hypothetical protein Caci_6518 [Catenulispora acidiphila DSM 44928]
MDCQRRGARTRSAVLILAVLVTVAGCASSRPPRPSAPHSAGGPEVAAAGSVIATDASSLQWTWDLTRAEQTLTAQCMHSNGFAYTVPDVGPEPSAQTITATSLGSGYPATYGVTPESVSNRDPSDPGATLPSYAEALEGSPADSGTLPLPGGGHVDYQTGGCVGQARSTLFGNVRDYVASAYIPQVVRSQFGQYLTTYQPYVTALKGWQACMKAGGWDYANPQAAIAALQASVLHGTSATDLATHETAIADADTACDGRSHLRASTEQALTLFLGSLPTQTVDELRAVAASRVAAGRAAERAMAGT